MGLREGGPKGGRAKGLEGGVNDFHSEDFAISILGASCVKSPSLARIIVLLSEFSSIYQQCIYAVLE